MEILRVLNMIMSENEDESSESENDDILNIASSSSRFAERSNKVGITDQEKEDTVVKDTDDSRSDQISSKIFIFNVGNIYQEVTESTYLSFPKWGEGGTLKITKDYRRGAGGSSKDY